MLDHESVYSREKNGLKTQLEQIEDLEEAKVGEITELYEKWYNEFLKNWDKTMEQCISEAIKKGHKTKLELKLGIYNFSKEVIPEKALQFLKLGIKAVLTTDKEFSQTV